MEALIGQIEAISRETPVLMIFEDAHWADPSSLEVFGRLADKIDALRVLLFCNLSAGICCAMDRTSKCGRADDKPTDAT